MFFSVFRTPLYVAILFGPSFVLIAGKYVVTKTGGNGGLGEAPEVSLEETAYLQRVAGKRFHSGWCRQTAYDDFQGALAVKGDQVPLKVATVG